MRARIYKPCKTAMQSGRAKSDKWILEYFQTSATEREPIMGWLSGKDTQKQVKLKFNDLDSAIAYAEKNRISYIDTYELLESRADISLQSKQWIPRIV